MLSHFRAGDSEGGVQLVEYILDSYRGSVLERDGIRQLRERERRIMSGIEALQVPKGAELPEAARGRLP